MWREYFSAKKIEEVLDILAKRRERARIIAGGTDLLLEIERKIRTDIKILIDISRIPDLDKIVLDEDDVIHMGPLVTHSHCVQSKLISERALPLAQAAIEVGAPQIRNRGTVARPSPATNIDKAFGFVIFHQISMTGPHFAGWSGKLVVMPGFFGGG